MNNLTLTILSTQFLDTNGFLLRKVRNFLLALARKVTGHYLNNIMKAKPATLINAKLQVK